LRPRGQQASALCENGPYFKSNNRSADPSTNYPARADVSRRLAGPSVRRRRRRRRVRSVGRSVCVVFVAFFFGSSTAFRFSASAWIRSNLTEWEKGIRPSRARVRSCVRSFGRSRGRRRTLSVNSLGEFRDRTRVGLLAFPWSGR
jgi:hypothetical protein